MFVRLLKWFPFLGRPGFWAGLWALWFATLFVLSSMSHPGPEIHVDGIDKLEHAAVFACGGAVLAVACALWGKSGLREALTTVRWGRLAMVILAVGAAVGWFDEWHQTFTPGRSGLDFHDWLADITGSLLAVPLAWLTLRLLNGRMLEQKPIKL